MPFFSYLFPCMLYRTATPYNIDIRIVRGFDGVKVLVAGSPQSGPYIRSLWQRAFQAFGINGNLPMRKILVLGLGGGTVIRMLLTLFPSSHIDVVEIDETMIHIARKYFGISESGNVSIIHQDAKNFVAKAKIGTYDLVIVDIFSGRFIPEFVAEKSFGARLRIILKTHGVLLINYLREREYKTRSDEYAAVLRLIFLQVSEFSFANNRFFFCRK